MTRARGPGRIRITLTDGPGPSGSFALPPQKTWPVAILLGAMCVAFAIPWIGQIRGLIGHRTDTVESLAGLLFSGFWVLGWSVAVLGLLAGALLLALYRDEFRAGAGKLAFVARAGPLRLALEYELARIHKLRTEGHVGKGLSQVCFDCGNDPVSFGRPLPAHAAEEAVEFIRQALDARVDAPVEPAFALAAEQIGAESLDSRAPSGSRASGWLPMAFLIVANLVPVVGVLAFDWDLAQIMVLFWAENGVVGFYSLLKLAVIQRWGALFTVPFFIGHFGGFMAIHFMFVYHLFVRGMAAKQPEPATSVALAALFAPLWTAILAMFISHGVSFFGNFLGRREYLGRTGKQQMVEPYRRVMVMHITLIFGGMAIMALGQPFYALLLLVVLKIAIDLYSHLREHRAPG